MERLKFTTVPTGGIDFDSHDKAVPLGKVIGRLNMRSSTTNDGEYGANVNVKGTILVQFDLPEGDNMVIGSLGDEEGQSIFYWVYNSNGDDMILRYLVQENRIVLVMKASFGFSVDRKITGTSFVDNKVLSWTDAKPENNTIVGQPMRSIDTERAILDGKKVCYEILVYGLNIFQNLTQYRMIITKPDGTIVEDTVLQAPNRMSPGTKRELFDALAEGINQSDLNNLVEAKSCAGCSMDICFKVEGDYQVEITSTNEQFHNIPVNRYPVDISDYHFNLLKQPPLCNPTFEPSIESNLSISFIDKKIFQFAYRIVFVDNQKSTISPYSDLVTNLLPCGASVSPYNCIMVDFTDKHFNDAKYLSEIKYVEILSRETTTSVWRSVEKIDRCDLTFPLQTYCFKNDGNYAALSEAESFKTAESAPKLAASHGVINNFGYWGSCLEGYDNLECIDAEVVLDYEEDTADSCGTDLITIRGRISIENEFITGLDKINLDKYQPIHDYGDGPVFGGFSNNLDPIYRRTHLYHPIPLGGFVVYVAGKNYYGISNQPQVSTIPQTPGIDRVVYDTDNIFDAMRLQQYIGQNKLIHTWEIKDIPKSLGKVIIRVASHLCTTDNTNGPIHNINNGIEWQKSSTFIKNIGGNNQYEIVVDLTSAGSSNVIDLNFSHPIVIQDLTDTDVRWTSATAGYIVDGLTNWSGNIDSINRGLRVENTTVAALGSDKPTTGNISMPGNRADHNGFFYHAYQFSATRPKNNRKHLMQFNFGFVEILRSPNEQVYEWNLQEFDDNSLTSVADLYSDNQTKYFIVYNRNEKVSRCYRTIVKGSVLTETGVPLQNVMVAITKLGRVALTDTNGKYALSIYWSGAIFPSKKAETIFFYPNKGCCPKFPEGNEKDITIPQFSCQMPYNSEEHFTASTMIGEIELSEGGQRWKKRNSVSLGVRYYDKEGRPTKIQSSDSLNTYIPFPTEPRGDEGSAKLSYKINHVPPLYAHKYQIVRTINPLYNKYLQFATNEVKYVKSYGTEISETTFEAGDATEIYIGLTSLIDFANENSGSVLSWEFNKGDRLTVFKDKDGAYYTSYHDFEVQNSKVHPTIDNVSYLIIKYRSTMPKLEPGVQVEVYSPKLDVQLDIYYEFGECHDIIDPETDQRRHASGVNGADQVVGTSPATGELLGGDTYYQNRTFPIINPEDSTDKFYVSGKFESEYIYDNIATSKQQSVGRFDVVDKEYGETYYSTRIRHTLRYLPDSRINGLNVFELLNYITTEGSDKEIDERFGPAIWIGYVGSVMKVVCFYKIIPVYIGSSPVYSIDGSSTIGISSKIANIGLPRVTDRGSENPESIVVENGELYGYDRNKGVWWRDTQAGTNDISDNMAQTYFARKSKSFSALPVNDRFVVSAYDKENEELYCSFPDETISFENIIYNETRRNEWMTFYSFVPEFYGRVGNTVVGFTNGKLWLHNASDEYSNFYGTQYEFGIDIAVNNNPADKKIFHCIKVKSNSLFTTPQRGITLSQGFSDVPDMVSELSSVDHWTELEGDYYADFLRNISDQNFLDIDDETEREVTALLRGEYLRGDVMKIKLRNNASKKVFLYLITVESSFSNIKM